MDKLLELLNEFEKEKKSWYTWNNIDSYDNCVYWVDCDWETEITMYSDLYSKQYWFIKWLVDNDKIDLKEFHKLCWIINQDSEYWNWTPQDYEQVIMYLSISDYPIEDLVSILK